MPSHLCLTVTFLDPRFHGRRDGGEPEWPPSPLRLYQAIVAAAAAPTGRIDHLAPALRWFENLPPPAILAPAARTGDPYRVSVPNNAMDLVAKAWAKGNYDGSGDANPATHRAMKTVQPTHLLGGDQVRFLWDLPDAMCEADRHHAESIRTAVRGIVALGWGVDLVVAHGELTHNEQIADSPAAQWERWNPSKQREKVSLRIPAPGTLDALIRRHLAFQNRVTDDGFIPVPPLSTFSIAGYRKATDLPDRPYAAFALRRINDPSGWRRFPQDRAICVAAMLRHAAWTEAQNDMGGWRNKKWAEEYVAGHGPREKKESFPRFSYLPLPTIGHPHSDGMIRRILIAENRGGDGRSANWAAIRLGGQTLHEEGTQSELALLQPISESNAFIDRYTKAAKVWQTITPVILPGYDDGKTAKRDRLLRQCLVDAGLDLAAVDSLESRKGSFDRASISMLGYKRPRHLSHLPTCHVRLAFHQPVVGPLAIGAGRHCGLGVFAASQS